MMKAAYIMRLDDACPTMLREIWNPLEETFDRLGIRPIVGVIPDNRDPTMLCSESDPNFWDRVRHWEEKGWGIALHGLHHAYHTIPSSTQALMPVNSGNSEFVGLSLEQQRKIIKESWRIFCENGIKPTIFMAPSHTFDENTLHALCAETDIRIVTDGYALFPFQDNEFIWIPQQLGCFRSWLSRVPFGIWTVCLHPSQMNSDELNSLVIQLSQFSGNIVAYQEVIEKNIKRKGLSEKLIFTIFNIIQKIRYR
jgi:predicted deacetylase